MPVRPRRDSTVTPRTPRNTRGAQNADETSPRRNVSGATTATTTTATTTTRAGDARATAAVLGGLSRRESAAVRGQGTVLGDGVTLRGGRLLVEGQPVVA